jgi:hypothetical protein
MGWWKFYYVAATPEMKIYFNPLDNELKTWELIESITATFPDSRGYKSKVTFGFCDGRTLKSRLCGTDNKDLCEREGFLDVLDTLKRGGGADFSRCEVDGGGFSRVVAVSYDCSASSTGFDVCITPPNSMGIGNVYSGGKVWVYKDPLDLLVFILAGSSGAGYFENSGEDFFILKNMMQQREIDMAAEISKQRYRVMIDRISRLLSEGELSASSEDAHCIQLMERFSMDAEELSKIVSEENYYLSLKKVSNYKEKLETLKTKREELVNTGCDYET